MPKQKSIKSYETLWTLYNYKLVVSTCAIRQGQPRPAKAKVACFKSRPDENELQKGEKKHFEKQKFNSN